MTKNWKTYKLSELAEINPKVSLKQGNEYSFVEMKDLDATLKYVSPSVKKELKGGSKFQNGDTLFARITPCLENGKICQVKNLENEVGFGSTEFMIFRGKENLSDTDFIYYITRTDYVRNAAVQAMTGTSGRQRVEKSALQELEVVAPDLKSQTQIASILSSLDNKIELNLQMNQTLEAMAQAIFKEWFVNFNYPSELGLIGFKDGRMDAAKILKSSNPKNHNSDNLVNGLPQGWKKGKLGDEFVLVMGQSPPGETYNEIGQGSVFYQGRTDFGFRFPENRVYTTYPNRIAEKYDTLVSVRAPVGDVNMAIERCCIGRGLSAVIHKTGAYSYTFYSMQNLYSIFRAYESEGTVFGSINKTNFENIEINVPSNEIIENFEKVANSIDEKIMNNSVENKLLIKLRDSMLPNLMNGTISV